MAAVTVEQAAEALARMGLRVGVVCGADGNAYLALSHPEVDGAVGRQVAQRSEARPRRRGWPGRGRTVAAATGDPLGHKGSGVAAATWPP